MSSNIIVGMNTNYVGNIDVVLDEAHSNSFEFITIPLVKFYFTKNITSFQYIPNK